MRVHKKIRFVSDPGTEGTITFTDFKNAVSVNAPAVSWAAGRCGWARPGRAPQPATERFVDQRGGWSRTDVTKHH